VIESCFTSGNGFGGIQFYTTDGGSLKDCISNLEISPSFSIRSSQNHSAIGNKSYRAGGTATPTPTDGMHVSLSSSISFIGNTIYAAQGNGLHLNGTTFSTFEATTIGLGITDPNRPLTILANSGNDLM
jgi:hypothetical protein